MASLNNLVMRSLRWLLAGRLAAQLITWSITIFVIRLLTPADYGLMALAGLFVGFFSLFEELGMSAALIQKESISHDLLRNVLGLLCIFGLTIYLLIVLLAQPIARFFDEPLLAEILPLLALRLPLASINSLPSALLQREMNFQRKSIIDFVAAIGSSVATLIFALLGFGVWSLIYGILVQTVLTFLGLHLNIARIILPSFKLNTLAKEIRFGSAVSLDRLVWYIYSQADVFFIGKFLGKEVLGIYAVAMQLATLPMQKIARILNEVGFAAFSRINNNLAEVSDKLRLAIRMLGLIAFPVFFGIASISPEIVSIVLGEEWMPVILPLTILAIVVPLRMINATTPTMLFGIGRPGVAATNGMIAALLMIPSFAMAAAFGDLVTVCLVWLLGYPVYFAIATSRAIKYIGLAKRQYYSEFAKYVLFGAAMFASVTASRNLIRSFSESESVSLFVTITIGTSVYGCLILLFDKQNLKKLWALARG